MSAQPVSKAAKRAIYRALLRNVPWAVGGSSHASKNIKRLIRADFEPLADANEADEAALEEREKEFLRRSEGTMLLLLSASRKARAAKPEPPSLALQLSGLAPRTDASSSDASSPPPLEAPPSKRSLKKAQPLAHRLVRNLASLTYHHLSPYVLMRTTRDTFSGGTGSASARRARAKLDEGEPSASLRVAPKPRLGPLMHSKLRTGGWKHINTDLTLLEKAVAECGNKWKEAKDAGKNEQYVERLWRNYVEERGNLKGARGLIEREERKRKLEEAPRWLLGGLARGLVRSNEIGIGERRWEKFRKGEWLG